MMQMKTFLLVACIIIVAGCVHSKQPAPIEIESAKSLSPQFMSSVTNALEQSPTFLELRQKAKHPLLVIEDETNGWVLVWLYSISDDFIHRWATLKVEAKSGTILKLGTDDKFEDEWLDEFQPQK